MLRQTFTPHCCNDTTKGCMRGGPELTECALTQHASCSEKLKIVLHRIGVLNTILLSLFFLKQLSKVSNLV